jgi:putative heme iron utilization protein
MTPSPETITQARSLLRSRHAGALATLSKRLDGYPFGSVVDYILDEEARPIILISTLAQHTQNIDADPRVSLLVHEASADLQASARLTVIGDAARIDTSDALKARYLRYFPNAEQYFAIHDFFFYRIEPKQWRYIGGFGDIYWIDPEAAKPQAGEMAEIEDGILAHMNRDHADSLRAYCRHFYGMDAGDATMVGIDSDGFDVRADGELLRFDFPHPVLSGEDARKVLTALSKEARP